MGKVGGAWSEYMDMCNDSVAGLRSTTCLRHIGLLIGQFLNMEWVPSRKWRISKPYFVAFSLVPRLKHCPMSFTIVHALIWRQRVRGLLPANSVPQYSNIDFWHCFSFWVLLKKNIYYMDYRKVIKKPWILKFYTFQYFFLIS